MSSNIVITPQHIAWKRKVGVKGQAPVVEMATTGGWHVIVTHEAGGPKFLAVGAHRALARHIAKKRNPDIKWTELQKSEEFDISTFEWLIPKYEAMTDALQQLSKEIW